MKILVITFGDPQAGSTKYRIVQYEPFLVSKGCTFEYVQKKDINQSSIQKIREADLLINQKSLLPTGLSRQLIKESRRVLFDFDDAIYTRPCKPYSWFTQLRVLRRLNTWLGGASLVTVANHYLSTHIPKKASRVEVVPMSLDLEVWKPKIKDRTEKMTLGWAGAPANLHHIERLGPILSQLLAGNPNLRLAIYSGKRPNLNCSFDFVPFKDGGEPSFVQQLDIGLLPLTDEEFSRGKSPIKAIQYLACGVPVVGNVYGATEEILNKNNSIAVQSDESWKNAVQRLVDSREMAFQMGMQGRMHIEQHFNKNKIQEHFWALLQELLRL